MIAVVILPLAINVIWQIYSKVNITVNFAISSFCFKVTLALLLISMHAFLWVGRFHYTCHVIVGLAHNNSHILCDITGIVHTDGVSILDIVPGESISVAPSHGSQYVAQYWNHYGHAACYHYLQLWVWQVCLFVVSNYMQN